MKKLPATHFEEVSQNGKIETQDFLRLRFSQPSAIYVSEHGSETLYPASSEHEVKIAGPFEVSWQAVKDLRVFRYSPPKTFHKGSGEVFTNMDRKPHESGMVYEVRKAMREQAIQHHQQRRELAAHAAKLRQTFQTGKPAPDPLKAAPEPDEPKKVDEPVDNQD